MYVGRKQLWCVFSLIVISVGCSSYPAEEATANHKAKGGGGSGSFSAHVSGSHTPCSLRLQQFEKQFDCPCAGISLFRFVDDITEDHFLPPAIKLGKKFYEVDAADKIWMALSHMILFNDNNPQDLESHLMSEHGTETGKIIHQRSRYKFILYQDSFFTSFTESPSDFARFAETQQSHTSNIVTQSKYLAHGCFDRDHEIMTAKYVADNWQKLLEKDGIWVHDDAKILELQQGEKEALIFYSGNPAMIHNAIVSFEKNPCFNAS